MARQPLVAWLDELGWVAIWRSYYSSAENTILEAQSSDGLLCSAARELHGVTSLSQFLPSGLLKSPDGRSLAYGWYYVSPEVSNAIEAPAVGTLNLTSDN